MTGRSRYAFRAWAVPSRGSGSTHPSPVRIIRKQAQTEECFDGPLMLTGDEDVWWLHPEEAESATSSDSL